MAKKSHLMSRHALLAVVVVILYLLLTRPEIIVTYRLGTVAWYPAIGMVCALLLGVSPGYAPVAAFAVALAGWINYEQSLSTFGETLGAVSLALCYGGAGYVLRKRLQIDLQLTRRGDVIQYLVVTFIAAAVNAVVGTACLAADGSILWRDFWPKAVLWFMGDGIGIVAISPFLLIVVLPLVRTWLFKTHEPNHSQREWARYGAIEWICQVLTIPVVVWLMFGLDWGRYHTFFLSFVPIIWMAMRQGIRRVVSGLVLLNFAIVLGMDLAPPPVDLLSKISLLMMVVSCAGLIVGSSVSERSRIAADLLERTTYLNALIDNSPLGIVVFNQAGRVEFANPAFEKLIQFKQRDLAVGDIATLWLEGISEALPETLAGRAFHKTVRQKRRDGHVLDLELHAVPLIVNSKVRGIYAIYEDVSEDVKAAESERKYAEAQARLIEELRCRARETTLLNRMGASLQQCETADEAATVATRCLQDLLSDALSGRFFLFKSSRKLLETATHWGQPGSSETNVRLNACQGLAQGRSVWSHRQEDKSGCQHLKVIEHVRSLCVPIIAGKETLGLLHFDFPQESPLEFVSGPETFEESQERLALTVAGQVGLALASIGLRDSLREQATRDPLTHLYNRRFLEEALQQELDRAKRGRHPVSLLFLDLDHFKRFNDTFGHEAGDTVLRSVAALLRTFFRSSDVCCRAGGEEFAVILPEAAPEHALIRSNAFRLELKGLSLVHEETPLGTITVSIGVAAFPDHATSPEELLRVADRCLYASKANGRNMVTLAGEKSRSTATAL